MNSSGQTPTDSMLDEAAAEWIFERESGFTPERERIFAAWCAEDPSHAEAVWRVEQTLALLDEMTAARSSLEARFGSKKPTAGPAVGGGLAGRRWLWMGGLAASIVLGVGAVAWSIRKVDAPGEPYATDGMVQRSLALADGSVMDIGVDSEVAVQLTPRERRITLRRGVVFFQVAHDPERAFIVTAGEVSVRAVGTAFEVSLSSDVVDVVVVEGKVALGSSSARTSPSSETAPPMVLAGERAQMNRSAIDAAPKIEGIDAASIDALLTWQAPMTSFADVPLRDVITRFNRRNATQIVIEDPELGLRKIGGKIALDQVDAFVRLLEQDGEIVADRATTGRIALHRAQ